MQKFFEKISQLVKNFLCEDLDTLHNFKNLRYIDGKGSGIHYYVLSST
jgi:hypothetical protein